MRALSVTAFATVAGLVGAAAFSACSLGLDESKIDAMDAAITDGNMPVDVTPTPDGSNPVQCNMDPDCKPANACLTGKCDTTRHQCVYTVCPTPMACQASVCLSNPTMCSVPTKYGFRAGSFHISTGDIGCGGGGGGARNCFDAIYPFVFVGTTNGVVARAVADPTDGTSDPIPVGGLPFFANRIVASGTRVYFVGAVVGTGPTYKVPVAWLDAPTDPTVKSVTATSVFLTIPVPAIETVLSDGVGGIYVIRNDGAASFPTGHLQAPLKDLDTVAFFPLAGIPMGHGPFGASGTRVVTAAVQGQYQLQLSLETGAATAGAQNLGAQDVTSMLGPMSGPFYTSQGPDGSLVVAGNALELFDGGGGDVTSARVTWLLADGKATAFDASKLVDVEPYMPRLGIGTDAPGPIAWLDANTVLVLSAPNSNTQQTAVQVASRAGAMPAMVPNRKFVLAFHPSQLAAAGSNGFGYVLSPGQTGGADVTVFGTGCDN